MISKSDFIASVISLILFMSGFSLVGVDLFEAVQDANLVLVQKFLNNNYNVNSIDQQGRTALSVARDSGYSDIEQLLEGYLLRGKHLGIDSSDKHFIILVASYNNKQWYKRNLDSIFSQKYSNYTVIYTDDLSTDGTGDLVAEYTKKNNLGNRLILIRNSEKKYCLGNYLYAIHRFCPNDSIVVTVDGDDWLAHDNVLSLLNKIYSEKDVWITHGTPTFYPSGKRETGQYFAIPEKVLQKNSFRDELGWYISHLRSFYTWLFRKINHQDFLDQHGQLFRHTEDLAFMIPMIEMAGKRVCYISDELYIFNNANDLNTYKITPSDERWATYYYIFKKNKYSTL